MLTVTCNYQENTCKQVAKNVVHAWNGYGQKDKFLPQRLADQIEPARVQAVALKNKGIVISKNLNYN